MRDIFFLKNLKLTFFITGFLVDFVSTPVVAGFTSAGALTIASSQVKSLFGIKFQAEKFFDIWMNVYENINQTKLWDTVLGLSCCIVLLLMRVSTGELNP